MCVTDLALLAHEVLAADLNDPRLRNPLSPNKTNSVSLWGFIDLDQHDATELFPIISHMFPGCHDLMELYLGWF